MKRPLAALLAFVALAGGAVAAPLDDADPAIRFPLAVGNRWEYRLTGSSLSDETGQLLSVPFSAAVTWRIDGRDEVRGESAFRFAIEQAFVAGPDSGSTIAMDTWFVERGDTLMAVASRIRSGSVRPVWAQLFKPVADLPPDAADWHFVSLVYPLRESRSWRGGNPIATVDPSGRDTKSVGPLQPVSVPAGSFDAWPVTYVLQGNGVDVAVDQWFAAIGLVRLDVVERYGLVQTDESGQQIGATSSEARAQMELASYEIVAPSTQVRPVSWGETKRLRR